MSRTTQNKIALADGRQLGFAEFGNLQGKAVFYFHGYPGSRLEAELGENIAKDFNIRFIGIDRPGFGLSDFSPNRTIGDWPDDVTQLADTLGFDRFSILGVSGGGPYAVACAFKIPQRLISVGIVCGMGPLDVPNVTNELTWMLRKGPDLARRIPSLVALLHLPAAFFYRYYPERVLAFVSGKVDTLDRLALKNNELKQTLSRSFREAFRSSLFWPSKDLVLYCQPWGFRLEDIQTRVYLWHGEKDRIVMPAMGHHLANTLPNCRAIFYPEEGHFSLIVNRLHEIWETFCT
jgi:pimeloyl-ACP methyl ester carboxylesterase